MTLIISNGGDVIALNRLVNNTTLDNLKLHLYTNSISPSKTDTASTYTEPSGATGYAAISLTGASWTVATVSSVTTASYTQQTFTFTSGPVTVVGYFLTDNSGNLVGAEQYTDGPYNIPSGGGTILQPVNIVAN
jgi:uncharacterized membrane protein